MSSSYKIGWNGKTVSGSLDPWQDRLEKANEFYDKMLLEGLKVFLAEVKFTGVRMVIREPGSTDRRLSRGPCVRINMPKGELGLGWDQQKRKWMAEVIVQNPVHHKHCFYSKSVEKMESRVRELYNELK